MPLLKQRITQENGLFTNDHFTMIVAVSLLPTGITVTKAWMTIKAVPTDVDPGVIQKTITTTAVSGVGQITDNGATSGSATLQFDYVPGDTFLLTAKRQYYWDIQVKYSDATVHTVIGDSVLIAGQGITQQTV